MQYHLASIGYAVSVYAVVDDLAALVGRAVVNEDELQVLVGLGEERLHATAHIVFYIIERYED